MSHFMLQETLKILNPTKNQVDLWVKTWTSSNMELIG